MRQTKWCMMDFAFYDRTGISRRLEEEAEKGWLLEKVSALGWKFRRITPQKIHFSVVYFAKASAFDPEPSEKQLSFQDFCEYAGWKLAASNAQMQIFYNESEDPTPIETDAEIELTSIHATAKKTELMSNALLIFLGLMEIGMEIGKYRRNPLWILTSNVSLFGFGCWILCLIYATWQLIGYFLWYKKAKIAAETDGSFVETINHRKHARFLLIIMIMGLCCMLASYSNSKLAWIALMAGVMVLGIPGLMVVFMNFLKKKKVSAKANLVASICLVVLASFGWSYLMIRTVSWQVISGQPEEQPELETYEHNGMTWTVYHDALPLTIEDLKETDHNRYSYRLYPPDSSFLLDLQNAEQRPRADTLTDEFGLEYTIATVKFQPIYEMAKKAMLKEFARNYGNQQPGEEFWKEARPTEAAPWGAEEAYQLLQGGEAKPEYLLCYEECFVLIQFDWDWNLTEEQMAVVGEKLQ